MATPSWYNAWHAALDQTAIAYGFGGIELYPPSEIEDAQLGYAIDEDGGDLTGTNPGDWSPEWIVIGQETACGDPIFVSAAEPHPVFTAMHGEDTWDPQFVASSLAEFAACLTVFASFAVDRSDPVSVEENPPSDDEQIAFLREVKQLTGDTDAWCFWAILIEADPSTIEP